MSLVETSPVVLVSSRCFDEYIKMFALSDTDLFKPMLDCAAGASEFTSVVNNNGGRVRAVDPLYAKTIEQIGNLVRAGLEQTNKNTRDRPQDYNWTVIRDAETHYSLRRKSAERFMADFATSNDGSYNAAAFPNLPYADNEFEISLCSYLLFTYSKSFDAAFHIAAIEEMIRVSKSEVRIFPLVGYEADASQLINLVLAEISARGIKYDISPVEYEFQKGGGSMLRVRASQ